MTGSPQIEPALRRWMEVFMTRSMQEWSRYVKTSGLSMPQFRLLMELYYKGPCGISRIGDEMAVTNAAASQLVERLVQGGLLERIGDPQDRRVRKVTLSEHGRAFVNKGIEQRYAWFDGLASGMTLEQRRVVARALTLLTDKAMSMQAAERAGQVDR